MDMELNALVIKAGHLEYAMKGLEEFYYACNIANGDAEVEELSMFNGLFQSVIRLSENNARMVEAYDLERFNQDDKEG